MSNKMKNKQYWVICQIQPERNYFNRLVATYTNFDKALANCKALNANYGKDIPDDFDCLDVSNVQELYKKYSLHCYVKNNWRYIMLETGTEVHVCSHCKAQFTITNKEKQFYLSKGLHLPKKCKKCRQERKAMIIKQEGFTLKDILVRR